MQLETKTVGDFERFYAFYNVARSIVYDINLKIDKSMAMQHSMHFEQELQRSKALYPLTEAKFSSMNAQLHTISHEQKCDLKKTLLEEMRGKKAKMEEEITGKKVLFDEELPDDEEECLLKIEEMRKEAHEKMEEIKQKIGILQNANSIINAIKDNKRSYTLSYKEDEFTSNPKKRARNA